MTRIPAACAARMPFAESSIAAHRSGGTSSRRAASRNTSGAGLPRGTSSEETVTSKRSARPPASSTPSISSRFDDDARARRKDARSRLTASAAPSISGSSCA